MFGVRFILQNSAKVAIIYRQNSNHTAAPIKLKFGKRKLTLGLLNIRVKLKVDRCTVCSYENSFRYGVDFENLIEATSTSGVRQRPP